MIQWKIGTVLSPFRETGALTEYRVRMETGDVCMALQYASIRPSARPGDTVLMNTTALDLNLGSGGVHFIHAVLNRSPSEYSGPGRESPVEADAGHIMKLRYTSLQRSVLAAEAPESPHHDLFLEAADLERMPVLIGELHSMLPIASLWLNRLNASGPNRRMRIAYIMSEGGALPAGYSRHVARMKQSGLLAGTVTYGHAYGGDVETVNKFTALVAARHVLRADLAVVCMGPGITGTGTPLGHSGMETGELVNAAASLNGRPIVMPRVSFAERRSRHLGLSHHTVAALQTAALTSADVPFPVRLSLDERRRVCIQIDKAGLAEKHRIRWVAGPDVNDILNSQQGYPEAVRTMGRSVGEDPAFFMTVCAAAEWAWQCLTE